MKKRMLQMLTVVVLGLALAACGGNDSNNNSGADTNTNNGSGAVTETDKPSEGTNDTDKGEADNGAQQVESTKDIVDAILSKVEQPSLMALEGDAVKDIYTTLDQALVEDFTIMMPMMNVKTNEIAVFKVKDAKDIPAIEKAIADRATNVQKQFETYLPDQYENAKNYKVVTEGNYVLFVISEASDAIIEQFQALVKE